MKSRIWPYFVAFSLFAVLPIAWARAAGSDLRSGNLYGEVTDENAVALPGVTVILGTGETQRTLITNAKGEFRFLNLPPATYLMRARLEGFGPVEYTNIHIDAARNTNIAVTLNSTIEDVIVITAAITSSP